MTKYRIIEGGYDGPEVEVAESDGVAEALRLAVADVDPGTYTCDETMWVDVTVIEVAPPCPAHGPERIDEGGLGDNYRGTEAWCWADDCDWTADLASASDTVTIDPPEPACTTPGRAGHDWQAPHDLVGGLEQNPGVFGNGGGVIVHQVCDCGVWRIRDTWAQRNDTGEQGLDSVRYETAVSE